MNPQSFLGKATKYLRELSVVVVGIAITFAVSNWISGKNERQDYATYLSAVKLELEDNLKLIERKEAFFERVADFAVLLRSSGMDNPKDEDVIKYNDVITSMSFLVYRTSAFEMFKTSGAMRHTKDQKQLREIWECYTTLENLRLAHEFYMQQKVELLRVIGRSGGKWNLDGSDAAGRQLLQFFADGQAIGLKEGFAEAAQELRRALQELQ